MTIETKTGTRSVTPEKEKTFRWYHIRIELSGTRALYVRSYRNGVYTFCFDHTYAQDFSERKAEEHITRMNAEHFLFPTL